MAINYPKFDQKINDQVSLNKFQDSKARPGTIMGYDRTNNTAVVMLDEKYSNTVGSMFSKVPCPFTYGIQTVAPTPGTRCYVAFRDVSEKQPYIMNYFIDENSIYKNTVNNVVDTGIPKFMV